MIKLCTKFVVFTSTEMDDMKGDVKCIKQGGLR